MEEFLEEREDLVVIFFTKVDFEYHDYKALHHKFNTTEPPPNGQYFLLPLHPGIKLGYLVNGC